MPKSKVTQDEVLAIVSKSLNITEGNFEYKAIGMFDGKQFGLIAQEGGDVVLVVDGKGIKTQLKDPDKDKTKNHLVAYIVANSKGFAYRGDYSETLESGIRDFTLKDIFADKKVTRSEMERIEAVIKEVEKASSDKSYATNEITDIQVKMKKPAKQR